MSTLRAELLAVLARFDDDAFVALANKGLLRRAQKDLEKVAPEIVEESKESLVVALGDTRVTLDARGPARARCSCSSSGTCQHVLAAALWLKSLPEAQAGAPADHDDGGALREALLRMTAKELAAHAGKPGYRWAHRFVEDLDVAASVTITIGTHVAIGFRQPRMTMRYVGGGPDALLADVDLRHVEKYRVAAVLAFQRAHGHELTPPEPARDAGSAALDLGVEHRRAESRDVALDDSRRRFRAAAEQLLAECVELGLSHLSDGTHERCETLAVWARGCEYHRLALMLHRIADHVSLLLDRAGGADEHRLLDEMSVALALTCAIESASQRGVVPVALAGRARTQYDETSQLELWGLGASAWRSQSGYLGLTMIFWSPSDREFMSCTDARPIGTPGFEPRARHAAAGPWSGLGAPAMTAGRRVVLARAQKNAVGRLSASDRTSASILPPDPPGTFARGLLAWESWTELAGARASSRRSLLAESAPMKDWVALKPSRWDAPTFSASRQVLTWPLFDRNGGVLPAELQYDALNDHAIHRIEALGAATNDAGTILIARLRAGSSGLVAEPLSLVLGDGFERNVDSLHFDPAPTTTPGLVDRLRKLVTSRAPLHERERIGDGPSPALREIRRELRAQAERGIAAERTDVFRENATQWCERAAEAGLTAFASLRIGDVRAGEAVLRLNYLGLQLERLAGETSGWED